MPSWVKSLATNLALKVSTFPSIVYSSFPLIEPLASYEFYPIWRSYKIPDWVSLHTLNFWIHGAPPLVSIYILHSFFGRDGILFLLVEIVLKDSLYIKYLDGNRLILPLHWSGWGFWLIGICNYSITSHASSLCGDIIAGTSSSITSCPNNSVNPIFLERIEGVGIIGGEED